jgi:hypothetical protein
LEGLAVSSKPTITELTNVPTRQAGSRSEWRSTVQVVGPVTGGLLIGFLFITSILGAYHAPSPHNEPIAVVAPPQVTTQIRSALDARRPDAFDLQPYGSRSLAERALKRRDVDAAFVVSVGHLASNGAPRTEQLAQAGSNGASVRAPSSRISPCAGRSDVRPILDAALVHTGCVNRKVRDLAAVRVRLWRSDCCLKLARRDW